MSSSPPSKSTCGKCKRFFPLYHIKLILSFYSMLDAAVGERETRKRILFVERKNRRRRRRQLSLISVTLLLGCSDDEQYRQSVTTQSWIRPFSTTVQCWSIARLHWVGGERTTRCQMSQDDKSAWCEQWEPKERGGRLGSSSLASSGAMGLSISSHVSGAE